MSPWEPLINTFARAFRTGAGASGAKTIRVSPFTRRSRPSQPAEQPDTEPAKSGWDNLVGMFTGGSDAPADTTSEPTTEPAKSGWDTLIGMFSGAASSRSSGGAPGVATGSGSQEDRDILAKTLQAEAGGEGYRGMLAAGAVINNRVVSGGYGDGVRGVIMKPGQFSAWNAVTGYAGGAGAINMDAVRPTEDAYRAADALLSGQYEDPTGGALHYYNPSVANPAWGQKRAGGDWTTIGNHIFGTAPGEGRNR